MIIGLVLSQRYDDLLLVGLQSRQGYLQSCNAAQYIQRITSYIALF